MLVQASALTKQYGSLVALDGCSFSADRGEVLGLLGPNGAGKTTLLRLLLGFLKPTSGRVTINGFDCYRQSVEVHHHLTYLPGDPRMFRRLTGQQVLQFFAQLRQSSSAAVDKLVQRLELDDKRPVRQMSTGMRQKLALAATLAPEVPLVVLDEPTSNLDPTVRSDVLQLIHEAKQEGKTVLFSSHVLTEVEEVCDRVILLKQGRIAETLRVVDVSRHHRIRARLTGPLSTPDARFADALHIEHDNNGSVTMTTSQPLQPLLGWLAEQPLAELRVEPVGLRAVYERHHRTSES